MVAFQSDRVVGALFFERGFNPEVARKFLVKCVESFCKDWTSRFPEVEEIFTLAASSSEAVSRFFLLTASHDHVCAL
jgi:hypothetical protein